MDGHQTLRFSERCLLTVGLLIMLNFEAVFRSVAAATFQDPITRPNKATPLQVLPQSGAAERRRQEQDPWLPESLNALVAAEDGRGARKQQAQAAVCSDF